MRHQPARHVELREGARAAARGLISVVRGGQRVGVGAGAVHGVGAVRERVRVAALPLAIIGFGVVTFRQATIGAVESSQAEIGAADERTWAETQG